MHSENEDDPGSSSEWKEDDKKKVKRRRSNRKTKKIRFSLDYSSNDDSDQDWNHTRKGKGSAKRKINNGPVEVDSSYTSGSFLISKLDMQNFDQLNPPHIWRIDGKFLLQKFEPFIEDKKLKYRNTSIYTGWSPEEKCKYEPLEDINIILQTSHKLVLSLNAKHLNPEVN